MDALNIRVRRQRFRDIQAVTEIEKLVFDNPWSEEDFMRCLDHRNCIGMVAVDETEYVHGYMLYELNKHMLHVLNFVVRPGSQRRQIGRKMIIELTSKLSRSFRTQITMELRETNLPAQQFLRACGFRATAIMKDYWDDKEDAYKMTYCLPSQTVDKKPNGECEVPSQGE